MLQAKLCNMIQKMPEDLILNNAFWQYSLKQWGNKPLQKLLLRLQNEQNQRVNILLFSMWLATQGKTLVHHLDQINNYTRDWHIQVVHPIREIRKDLPSNEQFIGLKKKLQEIELEAEQYEQALLYKYACSISANQSKQYRAEEKLVLSLSASKLSKSDLSLLLKLNFPMLAENQISEMIDRLVT